MKFHTTRALFFFCCALILSYGLSAQTNSREIGIRLGGLNNFDFIYKKQKSEDRFKRYRLIATNLNFQHQKTTDEINFSVGVAIGTEHRKAIAENLLWIHGWEPSLHLNFNQNSYVDNNGYDLRRTDLDFRPAIGYVLGFQYDVSEHFYVSLETIPQLRASIILGTDEATRGVGIGAGFSTNAIALSAVYRFSASGQK